MSLSKRANEILKVPLECWEMGWLKFECASLLNCPSYITMTETEKKEKKYPFSKEEMIDYLRSKGEYK